MDSTNNFSVKIKHLAAWLTSLRIAQLLMRLVVAVVVPRRRIGAGVVLFNDDGKVLLLEHAFHGDKRWGLPGGWMDKNESPREAAIRELREETGLSAELGDVIHLDAGPEFNQIDAFYLATEPQGDIKVSYEIVQAKWFTSDQLPHDMPSKTRRVIDSAFSKYHDKLPC